MSDKRRLAELAVVLNERDNVATALVDVPAGEYVLDDGRAVPVGEEVRAGFKLASAAVAAGEEVCKYGYVIGTAKRDIGPGECVHVHNLASGV